MISDAKRYCESLTVICRKKSRSAAWPTPTCHFQPYRLPLSLRKQHALATSFPIKNAWTIADALGCSIDSLVGRGTDVPENSESGIFLRQFESLSEDGRRFVRRAGFEGTRPYALRHTFATINLARGENVKTISVLLGHTDASYTLDLYVGFIPATTRGLANRYVGGLVPRLAA